MIAVIIHTISHINILLFLSVFHYILAMKKKINYTDEPMDNVTVIDDFLPSPEELAFKEETVKVTISLSRASVDVFKRAARNHHGVPIRKAKVFYSGQSRIIQ